MYNLTAIPPSREASHGLPLEPFWFHSTSFAHQGAKWLFLSRFVSLCWLLRISTPTCRLHCHYSPNSQFSCRCLRTKTCVQLENLRPSRLGPLLLAGALSLSLSRRTCSDWSLRQIRLTERPGIQVDTFTPASAPLSEVLGDGCNWLPFETVETWPAQLEMVFRQLKCIFVPTLCPHLPGWTWYSQKPPEITSLNKNLAELTIMFSLIRSFTQQMFIEPFTWYWL